MTLRCARKVRSKGMVEVLQFKATVWPQNRPMKLRNSGGSIPQTPAFHRAAACDVTGGVASLNFDATELQIFLR